MSTIRTTLALLATLTAGAAFSQETDTTGAAAPAPIQRVYSADGSSAGAAQRPQSNRPQYPQIRFVSISPGVWLRSTSTTRVQTLSATPEKVEIRIDRGVANLNVHHPENRPQILVDMPGGQTAILKDGLYTFNAESNTVRTLKGEAEVFSSTRPDAKSVKVKEEHALTFTGAELKPYEFSPMELRGDLLPGATPAREEPGYGYAEYGYGPYGDGFYPGYWGFYGDPYWGYGPYWGGYPFGFGVGFGYTHFGGYRGFRR